jgi:hypothetical protein
MPEEGKDLDTTRPNRVRIQVVVRESDSVRFANLATRRDTTEADAFRYLLRLEEKLNEQLLLGGELFLRGPDGKETKLLIVG